MRTNSSSMSRSGQHNAERILYRNGADCHLANRAIRTITGNEASVRPLNSRMATRMLKPSHQPDARSQDASEHGERGKRATRPERAGEAARESACRGVRARSPSDKIGVEQDHSTPLEA